VNKKITIWFLNGPNANLSTPAPMSRRTTVSTRFD